MDSFIKYFGGKFALKEKIISMIPPHQTYIEAFCGASWVLFEKPPSLVEVINDVDDEIINLYLVIQNQLSIFKERLNLLPISESLFSFMSNEYGIPCEDLNEKEKKNIPYPYGIPEMATKTYYKLMNCFNGNYREKPQFSFSVNRRSGFVKFYNTDWDLIRNRLKEVTILNRDFREILKKYDDPNSFFYLDPPYLVATNDKSYYRNTFTEKDHNELLVYLEQLEGKFILSYGNDDIIKDIYENFNIIGSENNPNELLITNYDVPEKSYFRCSDGIPRGPRDISRANWDLPNCPYCGSRDIQQVSKRVTLEGSKRNWIPCGFTCRNCGELYRRQ
ncbi:MAG: DNA adenine methylase [Promethearchaeota archaeon]|nr:MAG: DNA adenine methylase [Candidatus Lokiarchaeota archaeon]